ncbi:DNA-processing protein DprA [soil metagenome]
MPLSPAGLEATLALALLEGLGPSRLSTLVGHFGSAEGALRASSRELQMLPGLGGTVAGRIVRAASEGRDAARRAMRTLARAGAVALTPEDAAYPACFHSLPDPPYLLFACGDLSLLDTPAVAVVGTRTPTPYGRTTAKELSSALARSGYTIVSGMARGIDAIAQAAALEVGGSTIGVLGNGIEQSYPPENRPLFSAVRDRGLLITEFLPGETPKPGNFPRRNRLIVALGRAVLVVEMGFKSGAQHTVTYALEQGREVLAVPGNIDSPASAGTNQLIKEGARLVSNVQDVLEELQGVGTTPALPLRSPAPSSESQAALALLSPSEGAIFDALAALPRHVDDLCRDTQLVPGVTLGALLELELKGLAEALPGKLFRRA